MKAGDGTFIHLIYLADSDVSGVRSALLALGHPFAVVTSADETFPDDSIQIEIGVVLDRRALPKLGTHFKHVPVLKILTNWGASWECRHVTVRNIPTIIELAKLFKLADTDLSMRDWMLADIRNHQS